MSTLPSVTVSARAAKSLRNGHPWAFRAEVSAPDVELPSGSLVDVLDSRKHMIGRGFFNPESLITLRLVTRGDNVVDDAFWKRRLERAKALRERLERSARSAIRQVHGEADGIPGLIVDQYGDYLVCQMLTAGVDRAREKWVSLLADTYHPRGILARNDQKVRRLEGLEQSKGLLYGEVPAELEIEQHGQTFVVDPWNGQKTGAYLDQHDNRAVAASLARGRVLDAFCYQGWFAIACAARASRVVAVDGSEPALEVVQRNASRNGVANVETVKENVFQYLHAMDRAGEKFDTIVLDPPAFAKSRSSIASGERGYKEINLRAIRLLSEGGILVTCSCSYHMPEARFLQVLGSAARDSGRAIQLLEKRAQAPDHPMLMGFPESHYLKCVIARVL